MCTYSNGRNITLSEALPLSNVLEFTSSINKMAMFKYYAFNITPTKLELKLTK